MQSCELLMDPFSILCQRFHVAPHVIIYDNAFKLHQYCLIWEPHFFSNVLFVVDWFHWWVTYIGCSAGCRKLCKLQPRHLQAHVPMRSIPKSTNRQMPDSQWIRGQIAYMTAYIALPLMAMSVMLWLPNLQLSLINWTTVAISLINSQKNHVFFFLVTFVCQNWWLCGYLH